MDIEKIGPGANIPDEINVIIEIPAHSDPVKYEVDKKSGALFVDRFMTTAMFYPTNYGYIPQTLSEDGDPIDVLVVSPAALMSGAVIACRPVGMLRMTDESGVDAKILAVPMPNVSSLYDDVHAPSDLSPHLLATIAHFFEHYKDLDQGKWVKVEGWEGADVAKAEILASIERMK